jgi:hypothetical protein
MNVYEVIKVKGSEYSSAGITLGLLATEVSHSEF